MKKNILISLLSLNLIACNVNQESSILSSSFYSDDSSCLSLDNTEKKISTIDDLINIKNNLSGNYLLKNNIVLPDTWTGIGSKNNPFTGFFNGNGYKIIGNNTNLLLTNEFESSNSDGSLVNFEYNGFAGIFNYSTGSISNLNIEGSFLYQIDKLPDLKETNISFSSHTLKHKIYLGIAVGYNDGIINNIDINSNLTGKDNIIKSNTTYHRVGILCGKSTKDVYYCNASGTLHFTASFGKNARIGGLIGTTGSSITAQSSANVTITTSTSNSNLFVGGLIGYMEGGDIFNSYALSDSIIATGLITAEGNTKVGGLIGTIETLSKKVNIKNSYSKIDIISAIGKKSSVGGFIGHIEFLDSVNVENVFTSIKTISTQSKKEENNFAGIFVASIVEDANKIGFLNTKNIFYIENSWECNINLSTTYATKTTLDAIKNQLNWDFSQIWNDDFTLKEGEFIG